MRRASTTIAGALFVAFGLLAGSCSTGGPDGGDGGTGPPPPSAPRLDGLSLSVGTLSPAFDPAVHGYSVAVLSSVTDLTVTPIAGGGASVTLEGPGVPGGTLPIASGMPSPSIALSAGTNAILLRAISSASETDYEILVERASGPGTRVCPIVDRGSPTDGVTTITVLQAPAPCNAGAAWAGWWCMLLRSDANDNGASYDVDVRWNRVNATVRGSVVWVTGNDSTTHWREGQNLSPGVQDQLDTVDEVRSIDLAWTGMGTVTPPRNGYPNISSTYADVLEYLVTAGIATGVTVHFGNSGGCMMGVNAVVHHGLDQLLDGIVVGGGPFWIDLVESCTDNSSPLFLSAGGRATVDDWAWREIDGSKPCELMGGANPSFACRSTLSPDANLSFPNTVVAVVIGADEQPYIADSGTKFFQTISAKSKTLDRPAATPHNVLKTQAGANIVTQRIRAIVDAG